MTIKEELKQRTEAGESRRSAQVEVGIRTRKLLESDMSDLDVANELGLTEESIKKVRQNRERR